MLTVAVGLRRVGEEQDAEPVRQVVLGDPLDRPDGGEPGGGAVFVVPAAAGLPAFAAGFAAGAAANAAAAASRTGRTNVGFDFMDGTSSISLRTPIV